MIRRMIRLVALTALLLSVGGHWALIQSAAWAGMFLKFARQGSLHSAVIKTFDGKHPCQLCKLVDDEQRKETKPGSKAPDSKSDIQLYAEALSLFWVAGDTDVNPPVCGDVKAHTRSYQPKHSPPRVG